MTRWATWVRWPLAAAVVGAAGLVVGAMARVRGAAPSAGEAGGELATYEVSASSPLRLKLPGGLERVVLTTWAEPPPEAARDPLARFAYGLDVVLAGAERGAAPFTRTYATESRVSASPDAASALESAGWVARLADADDTIADARTITLRLEGSSFRAGGGELRLALAPWSTVGRVLVRASYPEGRSELARHAAEGRLDAASRRRLVEGRASLGFEDLSPEARGHALSAWGRRLDAIGREGVDFRARRLLLGDVRAPLPPPTARPLGSDVGGGHAAALNVRGAATLRIKAAPNLPLRVTEGAGATARQTLASTGPEGWLEARFEGAAVRTLAVEALAPGEARARFFMPAAELGARIASTPAAAPDAGGLVEITPEAVTAKTYRLDAEGPLAVRIAPGQDVLGVTLRAAWPAGVPPESLAPHATLRARWSAPGGASTEAVLIVPPLPRDAFDRFRDGADASAAWTSALRLPPGVEGVELFADAPLYATPWTTDPDVSTGAPRLPYRVPLAEGEFWRYAPSDTQTLVSLRPDNANELEHAGRALELVGQTRVEAYGLPPLPERSLAPSGARGLVTLLEPVAYAPGGPIADGAWTPLRAGRGLVAVESRGPRAGRLGAVFGVDTQHLGGLIRLLVDGREAARQVAVTPTGELQAEVPPGAHDVSLEGLGEGGFAFAEAPPGRAGDVYVRRSAAPLGPGAALTYRFTQRADEVQYLVLFVVNRARGRPWTLGYDLGGGATGPVSGRFFRSVTALRGSFEGPSAAPGRAWLWEGGRGGSPLREPPGQVSVIKVRLGDDLGAGHREVRLRLLGGETLWVRAVLTGQPAADETIRFWTESLDGS